MKLKYLIPIILVILFGYLLRGVLVCTNYNGNFHYSSVVDSFHLKQLIANEGSPSIILVRIFHNKLTVFLFDIFGRFIQFFDISYLIKILTLAGLFGLLNFYYLLLSQKIKNKFIDFFGVLILMFPLLEIFQITKQNFPLKMILLIIPYQIASFIGTLFFIKRNKKLSYLIYFILLILSVGWIFVFKNDALSFCTTG